MIVSLSTYPLTLWVIVELTPEEGVPLLLLDRSIPLTQGAKFIEGLILRRESIAGIVEFVPLSERTNDGVFAEDFSAQAVFRVVEQRGPQVLKIDAQARDWDVVLLNRPLDEYPQPLCPNFE